jgi:hypothetical protein
VPAGPLNISHLPQRVASAHLGKKPHPLLVLLGFSDFLVFCPICVAGLGLAKGAGMGADQFHFFSVPLAGQPDREAHSTKNKREQHPRRPATPRR